MKKIYIIICLLVGFISFSKAQGNLQFNKAKFIELEGMASTSTGNLFLNVDSIMISVPANKVWKLEHFETSEIDTSYGGILIGGSYSVLLLNSVQLQIVNSGQAIWLPTGTYKLKLMGTLNRRVKGFISAIEYNIVP